MAYYLTNMSRRRIIESQPNEITRKGSIVTFGTNLVRPLLVTASITPVQDLSGGEPYPPGGGKNKYDPDFADYKTGYYLYTNDTEQANGKYKYTQSYFPVKPSTTYAISYTKEMADAVGCYANLYDANKQYLTRITISGITGTGRVSGTFTTTADTVYARFSMPYRSSDGGEKDIQLEEGSTATSYSPYSHICPISGWTGAEVNGTGKNLLPNLKFQRNTSKVMIGQDTTDTNYPIYLKAGTYSFSYESTVAGNFCYKDKTTGTQVIVSSAEFNGFTIPKDDYYQFYLYKSSGITVSDITSFQLEVGSSASAYSAYSGTTLSVTFPTPPGTVYGGSQKVNKDGTGVLTGKYGKKTFTGANDETWISAETGGIYRYYTRVNDCIYNSSRHELISNMGVYASSGNPVGAIYLSSFSSDGATGARFYYVPPQTLTSVSDFKTWLSTNNLEIVYELATPVTYTLTSQQVGQLMAKMGVNHVWADTGDVEVKAWGF